LALPDRAESAGTAKEVGVKALRIWLVLAAASLTIPLTAASALADAGSASGTIQQCPGYPVPPFQSLTREGIKLTIGNICHTYAGTVSGTVRGVQYTIILADGSRMVAGEETLTGSVAGRHGLADLRFSGTRPCFPGCPTTIHLQAVDGSRGLRGLQLDITAVGVGILSYSGTYALGTADETDGQEGGSR
jgi:hypothetical protein